MRLQNCERTLSISLATVTGENNQIFKPMNVRQCKMTEHNHMMPADGVNTNNPIVKSKNTSSGSLNMRKRAFAYDLGLKLRSQIKNSCHLPAKQT